MTKCSKVNCKNYTKKERNKSPGLSFHRFPRDPLYFKIWSEFVGKFQWKPRKTSVLCSIHFQNEFFDRSEFRVRLRKNAVPTYEVKSAPAASTTSENCDSNLTDELKVKTEVNDNIEASSSSDYNFPGANQIKKEEDIYEVDIKMEPLEIQETDCNIQVPEIKHEQLDIDEISSSFISKRVKRDDNRTQIKKENPQDLHDFDSSNIKNEIEIDEIQIKEEMIQ